MKVLILGGGGIVASYLVETAPPSAQVSLATGCRSPTANGLHWIGSLDLTSSRELADAVRALRLDVVINAAGMNSVDACELDPDSCHRHNVGITEAVIEVFRESSCRLVHLSTNAVYDGDCPPYGELGARAPVNAYGRAKKASEDLVFSAANPKWTVVRLSPLYGWSHSWTRLNPLPWICASLEADRPIRLVDDIYDSPLSAEEAARFLWRIAASGASGAFNLGGQNTVSRFGLGSAIAEVFGLCSTNLIRSISRELPDLAPRPADSSLSVKRFSRYFRIEPGTLRDGLQRMRITRPVDDQITLGRLNAATATDARLPRRTRHSLSRWMGRT